MCGQTRPGPPTVEIVKDNTQVDIVDRWMIVVSGPDPSFIQDFELGGKQDDSRIIVVCEMRTCLLGGSGGIPPILSELLLTQSGTN